MEFFWLLANVSQVYCVENELYIWEKFETVFIKSCSGQFHLFLSLPLRLEVCEVFLHYYDHLQCTSNFRDRLYLDLLSTGRRCSSTFPFLVRDLLIVGFVCGTILLPSVRCLSGFQLNIRKNPSLLGENNCMKHQTSNRRVSFR